MIGGIMAGVVATATIGATRPVRIAGPAGQVRAASAGPGSWQATLGPDSVSIITRFLGVDPVIKYSGGKRHEGGGGQPPASIWTRAESAAWAGSRIWPSRTPSSGR